MQDGCLADSNDGARYGSALLRQSEAMTIYCRASLTMQIIIFILYYS